MRIRRKRRNRPVYLAIGIFVLFAAATFFMVDYKMQKVIGEMAEYRSKVLAVQAMSESVESSLQDAPQQDLISVERNERGEVVSIETEMRALNLLKAEITGEMVGRLKELAESEIEIPVGTLMGGGILTGRGPALTYRFVPQGAMTIRTISRFESCGINQTRHQILLTSEVEVGAITSFRSIVVKVPAEFVLAETVVVGAVPENYTQVLTNDKELLSNINDYQAGGAK